MFNKLFATICSAIKGLIHVDVSISLESGSAFAVSAEISMEMVNKITQNEILYVWSDFWNKAIAIDDLEFSHVDTNNVPGYRIVGTNDLVWRDQMTFVEVG